MIVCPKKLLPTLSPCEIAVCRSTINAGSDRWPVRLQTRVRWSSALGLVGIHRTEDDTSRSVTLQVPGGRQKSVDTAYDVGSVVSVLADDRLLKPTSVSQSPCWFLLMALDVWKEAKWR
ncbi:hypothetical protein TNCV_2013071 [Trichonephila clavipes]|nr:hypothetical protein TNCV_2013071 [Trichonephila clavipes]